MNRKITFILAIAVGTIFSWTNNANAQCSQSSAPRYVQPPVYSQPVYQQPVYTQPVYSQPVYTQPVMTAPVVVSPTPAPTPARAAKAKAKQLGVAAKQQFRNRQYDQTKTTLDELVKLVPNDASGWQFRSIVSFSKGEFDDAAADIYDAMQLGRVWSRKSVDNLYGEYAADYTAQLTKLNKAVADKPSLQGHFLLAYHHMVNEEFEAGKKELQKVLRLEPAEPLSQKLIAVLDQRMSQK